MAELKAQYLDIQSFELSKFLLEECGQYSDGPVQISELLSYLKLSFQSIDFDEILTHDSKTIPSPPRALLYYPQKIIAVHSRLSNHRSRFSTLHEIGHYVLPNHQNQIYLCTDNCLHRNTPIILERQANNFAAEILFKGDLFRHEANSTIICPSSVVKLAMKYEASIESTAIRYVKINHRPCMLAAFTQRTPNSAEDLDSSNKWDIKYCVTSPSFRASHFSRLSGSANQEVIDVLTSPGHEFKNTIVETTSLSTHSSKPVEYCIEYFYNGYNVFALITPLDQE